ncbi:hypothetical protein Nepgr_023029 [Nepenthes gracilis]|uniref:Uncharacterized protein n=1 Tax=Nepenthes gracilis TaxID=150966 RepID=A0AAD3T1X1_NEPGR|nr:hypothetical protein Nepgr_023029 [Nepenthes gracilis]
MWHGIRTRTKTKEKPARDKWHQRTRYNSESASESRTTKRGSPSLKITKNKAAILQTNTASLTARNTSSSRNFSHHQDRRRCAARLLTAVKAPSPKLLFTKNLKNNKQEIQFEAIATSHKYQLHQYMPPTSSLKRHEHKCTPRSASIQHGPLQQSLPPISLYHNSRESGEALTAEPLNQPSRSLQIHHRKQETWELQRWGPAPSRLCHFSSKEIHHLSCTQNWAQKKTEMSQWSTIKTARLEKPYQG